MRMIGYLCQPWCGKTCCREYGTSRKSKQSESQRAKQRELRAWRKEYEL